MLNLTFDLFIHLLTSRIKTAILKRCKPGLGLDSKFFSFLNLQSTTHNAACTHTHYLHTHTHTPTFHPPRDDTSVGTCNMHTHACTSINPHARTPAHTNHYLHARARTPHCARIIITSPGKDVCVCVGRGGVQPVIKLFTNH